MVDASQKCSILWFVNACDDSDSELVLVKCPHKSYIIGPFSYFVFYVADTFNSLSLIKFYISLT